MLGSERSHQDSEQAPCGSSSLSMKVLSGSECGDILGGSAYAARRRYQEDTGADTKGCIPEFPPGPISAQTANGRTEEVTTSGTGWTEFDVV